VTLPEIVAHRGASRERPENTLAAFERAVALGADGAELDVHRTADGVIVVHHDPGIEGAGPITALTAAQVAALRFRGEPIPTLAEVFATVGDRLRLYVELKGADTVPGVLALLRAERSGRPDHADGTAVHCFDHRLVAQAARLDPSVPRGVLEVSYPVDPTGAARPVQARDLWRHRDFVDAALVQAAHAEGRRVVAWTVNDAAMMRRFAEWGVDAICTDDVALARATLDS
jgi:glycerophosphoryl diester phosphodiesterase